MGLEIVVVHIGGVVPRQPQRFATTCVKIGRLPENEIAFPEHGQKLSRVHAAIFIEDGTLYVRDMGSRGGTFLNGRKLTEPEELEPEDTVQLAPGGPILRAKLARATTAEGQLPANATPQPAPKKRPTGEGAIPPTPSDGRTRAADTAPPADKTPTGAGGNEPKANSPHAADQEATAADEKAKPAPKKQKRPLGNSTLNVALDALVARERARNKQTLVALVGATLAVIFVATGGAFLWHRSALQDVQAAQARERAEREAELARLRDRITASDAEREKHETELRKLEGEVSASRRRIEDLTGEIALRDKRIEALRNEAGLSDAERRALVEKTQNDLVDLKSRLESQRQDARKKEDELKRQAEEAARRDEELRKEIADLGKGAPAARPPSWPEIVDRSKESIFLCLAQTKDGASIGTAFVIDGPKGLLATNTHVAKQLLDAGTELKVVIQNGTGQVFDVVEIKTHPQYNGPTSPDVALIRIGARNLRSLPLATDIELRRLRVGTALGTIGFPGELARDYFQKYDARARKFSGAIATFKDGYIGRITNYASENATFEQSTMIQHSASLTGGTSGSPMFTADGKVVALNNSGIEIELEGKRAKSAAQIGFAIRVDELRKLRSQTGW